MRSTKNQAFTLVELIVVITILAILGTIAFISLQGYSQDAKNSKVTSDVSSLAQKVNIKTTEANGSTLKELLVANAYTNTATNMLNTSTAYT
jgi:prepilin-type N-terminal cleavage/methylation domain-containing protein